MPDIGPALAILAEGRALSRADASRLFHDLVSGAVPDVQVAAMLMALRVRGEAVDEIVGAVDAMRAHMTPVRAPAGAIDIVGTGGDQVGSYNISTCTAFVVAGAGTVVAKHGNGKVSSRSGSADVLRALGVRVDCDVATVERCIAEVGIGFMFAPAYHPALKAVMPVRAALRIRTIFNLLGPLLNPAGVRRHLIGVYDRRWVEPIANALRALGSERAMVVHGLDGLDEVSLCAPTACALLEGDRIRMSIIAPEQVGLARVAPGALAGGDADANAAALCEVLDGGPGAYRDVVLFNAAAALLACGATDSWRDGIARARASIDAGAARDRLSHLIRVSNAAPAERAVRAEERIS